MTNVDFSSKNQLWPEQKLVLLSKANKTIKVIFQTKCWVSFTKTKAMNTVCLDTLQILILWAELVNADQVKLVHLKKFPNPFLYQFSHSIFPNAFLTFLSYSSHKQHLNIIERNGVKHAYHEWPAREDQGNLCSASCQLTSD